MQSGFDPPPPPQNPAPPGYPPPPGDPGGGAGGGPPGGGGFGPPPQGPYAPYAQYPNIAPAPGYVPSYGYGYAVPTEGKAVTALVLGIVSIFCFGPLTGIPAIILGALSQRDIKRSAGTLGGSGFAIGGIVTGALSTAISAIWFIFVIVSAVSASRAAKSIPTTPYPPSYTFTPPVLPIPTAPAPTATAGIVPSTTMHGVVKVVSLASGRSLQDQLVDLRASEIADGRVPIVETTASWCTACKEIESTLDDPLLQKALADVTLVKVDVDEFGDELTGLKMDTNAIPFFYKIDSTARPTDSISGDEWDDNTAANEAPVLGPFVKGTLKKRRHASGVGTPL